MKYFKMRIFFIAIIALTAAAQDHVSEEQRIKLTEYQSMCTEKSGVKPEVVENTKLGEFIEDPKLNEFLFCLSSKIGFQNEAGEFQKDVMRVKIAVAHTTDFADSLIAACASKTQSTPQLTSFELAKCFYKITNVYFAI